MTNKQVVATKGELALMGKTIECTDLEEAVAITDYILKVLRSSFPEIDPKLNGEMLIDKYVNRYSDADSYLQVKHIVCNTLMGQFRVITFLVDDGEEPYPDDLATQDGVLCYVYNVNAPSLSELGYCFFAKKSDNYYHRIG